MSKLLLRILMKNNWMWEPPKLPWPRRCFACPQFRCLNGPFEVPVKGKVLKIWLCPEHSMRGQTLEEIQRWVESALRCA